MRKLFNQKKSIIIKDYDMKRESDSKHTLFCRYFMLSIILSLANSLSLKMPVISLIIGIIEIFLWIYCLLRKKIESFMVLYFLFTATLIESNLFATGSRETTIYSFMNIPGLAYYPHFFVLFLAYMWNGSEGNILKYKIGKSRLSTRIAMIFPFYCMITLITCIMDDNGVISSSGLFRFVIIDAYNTLWFCLIFAVTWDCILKNKNYIIKLKSLALGVLSGVTVAAVILILLGYTYTPTNTVTYIQCPIILFFSPVLILFATEKKYGFFFLCAGLISIVIQLRYTVGIPGVWWITTGLFAIGFYIQCFHGLSKGKARPWYFFMAAASVFALIVIIPGLSMLLEKENSSYVAYKFRTFINLFDLTKGMDKWFGLLGGSIGIRVESMINIAIELLRKPYYLLFGKGFGGSVNRYWGIYNWNTSGASFPDVQIMYGVYSSFHVGLLEILINMGLLGLVIGFILIRDCIKSIFNCNKWLLFGTAWTLIFLYFYHSMFICMIGLCVGYYQELNKHSMIGEAEDYNE